MSRSEHEHAVRRLTDARHEQERLGGELRAAEGTPDELAAHSNMVGGRDEVAARGRWLEWVESEGPPGPTGP